MCMYDWGFLCAPRAYRCSWSPEGGDIFPQTGVTAVMRHSLWVLRSEPQSSLRTLNHWTMSCCVVFWDRVSFCITGCPETPGVDQTSLRLIGICLLLLQVLASKGRATTLSLRYLIYPWHIWRKEISYLGSLSTRKKDKTEFALIAEGRRWQHSQGSRCWQVLSPTRYCCHHSSIDTVREETLGPSTPRNFSAFDCFPVLRKGKPTTK